MPTSAEIARSRVESEDRAAYESRVATYQREIDEALGSIVRTKAEGKLETTLSFDTDSGDKPQRVRSALKALGYTCSEIEGRDGEWINGFGYHRYLAFDVQKSPGE